MPNDPATASGIKVGVISSLVASLLFYVFGQPLLQFISSLLFGIGNRLFHGITDRLFAQAALLTPPDIGLELTLLVLGGMVGLVSGFTAGLIHVWRKPATLESNHEETDLHPKRFPWSILVLSIVIFLVTVFWAYSTLFQFKTITSFKQHMVTLAPYISDQQAKQLYSEWTLMRSEDDYRRIYSKLTQLASQNHITLPRNYMFPVGF